MITFEKDEWAIIPQTTRDKIASMSRRIDELEQHLDKAIDERDKWKERALRAEVQLTPAKEKPPKGQDPFFGGLSA